MKAALLGGALAFALWGAPAFAGGGAHGGSGQVGQDQRTQESQEVESQDFGGSGEAGTLEDDSFMEDESLREDGLESPDAWSDEPGVGGAGDEGSLYGEPPAGEEVPNESEFRDDDFVGGSGSEGTMTPPAETQPRSDMWIEEETTTQVTMREEREERPWERGVTVLLGGGVEGYTGQLAPQINPGPQWGVGAAFKPTRIFGVELGYSGAVNNIDGSSGALLEGGDANVTRHGGHAVATLGLTATAVQPYILGGIGVDRYIVNEEARGEFNNNTVGQVPVGVGLRTNIGNFTADLRGNYGILFEQEFAPGVGGTDLGDIGDRTPTGRYGGSLRLGASF